MSATLGTLLSQLEPDWTIRVYERLGSVAQESSNPWNNAGTGHSALCELNYMPDDPNGGLPDPAKAIQINEQFQISRQLWSYLVEKGILGDPTSFINSCPHMTFVDGEKNVDYLRRRFQSLKSQVLFEDMEFSDDPAVIAKWAPLLVDHRSRADVFAATRADNGTDVDFGSITRQMLDHITSKGASVEVNQEVKKLKKLSDGTWQLTIRDTVGRTPRKVNARFVFVGAGGWALKLLQKSGIAEAKGYGTFPVSGEFLRTDNPEIVARHQAKVYAQAKVGAPPMSVPHLDTRVVGGSKSLLFGPYAGFDPRFLKTGSVLDLPGSLRWANLIPYLAVAVTNLGLVKYLVTELLKSRKRKFDSLLEFMPTADPKDWTLIRAGQRAQVIKKDAKKGGTLQFGTEVITSADGSISGLLGASPGASTAAPIMLDILKRCFSGRFADWEPKLKQMIPSYGTQLSADPEVARASLKATAATLKLTA